jgi:hypothetical protein
MVPVSPLRLIVLLAAAGASLAAAGRLWFSALTPRTATPNAQLEPNRIVWDSPARIRVAPDLKDLLQPQAAPTRRHVPAKRVRAQKGKSAVHAATTQYASLTKPAARPAHTAPAPRPGPKPVTKPVPAPVPTPTPTPTPPVVTPPAPTPPATTQPVAAPVDREPASSPPPATPPPATPPPPVTQPPVTQPPVTPAAEPPETRPGHGYGDQNHVHTGPPGKQGAAGP